MRFILPLVLSYVAFLNAPVALAGKVHFVVRVPSETPASETVYIAGSLPPVGAWKADGLKLARQSDGTYTAEVDVEKDQTLEFKVNRGNWETVEKNADGSEKANRSLRMESDELKAEITVERWADTGGAGTKKQSSVVGTLKLHAINSKSLGKKRTIRVWLPPNYETDVNAKFDVLYMHDGQNCFDRATSAFGSEWEIDETLTKLIDEKKVRPMIVVGIDNGMSERMNELTFSRDAKRNAGGDGAKYASFVLDEVKPFIEKTYRVETGPSHTFLGGSSLGGVVSLEMAKRHPNVFGGVIAMSTASAWNDHQLEKDLESDAGGLKGARVWLDMGGHEAVGDSGSGTTPPEKSKSFVADTKRIDAALAKHGVEHHLMIDESAEHNERFWAKRFADAIVYVTKVP